MNVYSDKTWCEELEIFETSSRDCRRYGNNDVSKWRIFSF